MANQTAAVAPATASHSRELASLRASQLQAKAAVEANGMANRANRIAEQSFDVALAQAILTLVATGFLVIAYLHSRRTLRLSQEALADQRRSFRIETRPYVHAHRATITQLEEGKAVEVEFFFRNSGQTPAIDTQAQAIVTLGLTTDPIPPVQLVPTQSKAVLGSQDERAVVASNYTPITAAEIQALKEEKLYVLISIGIAYTDIHGDPHRGTNAFRGVDGVASAPGRMQVRPAGNTLT